MKEKPNKTLSLDTFFKDISKRRRVDLSRRDDSSLPEDFKSTSVFELIIDRVNLAKRLKIPLILVTGAHGAGKTTTLRYYAQIENALYWECRSGYQAKHLLADIAQRLGISTGQGWRMQTSVVTEQLAAYPRTVILDEAQRLNYDGLDLLKYIADNSGSTFVLSASPSLATRIDRWPDISSRCAVRVKVSAMTISEFLELYQADGFNADALAEIYRLSSGIMRVVHYLIKLLDEELADFNTRTGQQLTRGDLQAGHIRGLTEGVSEG